MAGSIELIAGLGNPGSQYRGTRHNAGAWVVDALARQNHVKLRPESKFHGLYGRILIHNQPVHLLFPTTFMNRSGKALAALCHYYRIEPANVLVAHDELDLPSGTARCKQGGGHGGHNGLRDIIQAFGGKRDFSRLRVGIDRPDTSKQVVDYVLSPPGKSELARIESAVDAAVNVMPLLVAGNFQTAMNQLHPFKAC